MGSGPKDQVSSPASSVIHCRVCLKLFNFFVPQLPHVFFFLKISFNIYLHLAVLGLHWCTGYSLAAVRGPLIAEASCCRAWAPGPWASVAADAGLSSCRESAQ